MPTETLVHKVSIKNINILEIGVTQASLLHFIHPSIILKRHKNGTPARLLAKIPLSGLYQCIPH